MGNHKEVLFTKYSNISLWPEFQYGAIDLFVCDKVNPYNSFSIFEKEFSPNTNQFSENKRGIMG